MDPGVPRRRAGGLRLFPKDTDLTYRVRHINKLGTALPYDFA